MTTIYGDEGDNYLNGLPEGIERLVGRGGNDTYRLARDHGTVVEFDGGGIDTVITWRPYTLPRHVENLTLFGQVNWGKGNDQDNVMTGSTYGNHFYGLGGNDTLIGNGSKDWLYGGDDADRMIGKTGNDRYFIDHRDDVAIERGGEGYDRVDTEVSYTIAGSIELLILQKGTRNLQANGSQSGNEIVGNAGRNRIDGHGGNDVIDGWSGNDQLYGGAGHDKFIGNAGSDTLTGGAGRDKFVFESNRDTLPSAPDRITDFQQGEDRIDLRPIFDGRDSLVRFLVEEGSRYTAGVGPSEIRWETVGANTVVGINLNSYQNDSMLIVLTGHHELIRADFLF